MNLLDVLVAGMVGAAAMHIYKSEHKSLPAPQPKPEQPVHNYDRQNPTLPYHARFSLN